MAVDLQQEDTLPEIKAWYDGYTFGGTEIYNPWSVIMYFDAGCKPAPYWVNTSGNGIVKQMFKFSGQEGADDLQSLMDGGSVFKQLREGVVYANIGDRIDDLYSILLMTGYLKCVGLREKRYGEESERRIPNKEIRSLFGREILENFIAAGSVSRLGRMLDAMVSGHGDIFESVLSGIVRNNVSYHDAANGESFYHGMMLGFCILLKDTHIVQSNRESGYGRFDLALIPTDRRYYGVILEFKRAADEAQLEEKALEALAQIEELSYIAEFEQRQIEKVWKYGIAFCGKKVCLRGN